VKVLRFIRGQKRFLSWWQFDANDFNDLDEFNNANNPNIAYISNLYESAPMKFCSCLPSALCLLLALSGVAFAQQKQTPPAAASAAASAAAESKPLPAPSSAAQNLYEAARNDLLQIRVLLRNGLTQSSVGSGFLVGESDLVVTNYHVMSQIALEPDVYVGEFIDTNGAKGSVELLAVDVLHDLAVVRVSRKGTGFFQVPKQTNELKTLTQGQYLYSLGNPLDLGFAISEGSYNGIIGRAFYDQLMFTGPINSGMSGGPNINAEGQIAGVNVSKHLGGELVSFLVPAKFVVELLQKVQVAPAQTTAKIPKDFVAEIGRQLNQHQTLMVEKLLEKPLSLKTLGPYAVPVRESDQMRCWGRSNIKPENSYIFDQLNCQMESSIYVSHQLQTGHVSIQHYYTRSKDLGSVRFSHLNSVTFKGRSGGATKDARLTAPSCTEEFIDNHQLSMRAVMCVRGYRKFAQLYDFSLQTASTDQSLMHLQSRLDLKGVSFENGTRVAKLFLEALGKGSQEVKATKPAKAAKAATDPKEVKITSEVKAQ
jgi:serine protease Do